jgi:deazaflavin-dependent oxidoreductase (nitroreductase family)
VARTRMTFLRPFTTRLFNPLSRHFAGWLPGFGILSYVGRKSGRLYRTPLNVFKRGDSYVFALTYGSEVDWVRNVLAAGHADLRTRGRDIHLVEPELFVDPTRHLMPLPVRIVLRLNDVQEFLRVKVRSERT